MTASWPPSVFVCGECGYSTAFFSEIGDHIHFVSEPDYPVRRRDDDTPYHWMEKGHRKWCDVYVDQPCDCGKT